MTRKIPLTKGLVALVDDADYERVNSFKWQALVKPRHVYAVRRDSAGHKVRLHRFLLNAPDSLMVDHWNGDSLDCRRSNLRLCTRAQNARNARAYRVKLSSPFKGVTAGSGLRFRAKITVGDKAIHLGTFGTAIEAARAYDKAARHYHGAFARLNFPNAHEQPALPSPQIMSGGSAQIHALGRQENV
jgi:hypothetical protein